MQDILEFANWVFAGIFTLEFIIKYIGYGDRYFKDGWNIFDTVIVILTLLGIILGQFTAFQLGPQTTVIRSFRIARIATLFKRNKALKNSIQTFIISFPAMANIGSLIILVVLIYAILGVYMFADVKENGELNVHTNFQSVGQAFVTLITVSTGENWPKLMIALSRTKDLDYDCIENPTYDDYVRNGYQPIGCGDYLLARIYFDSFQILVPMVFMKLFIAIMLQTFKKTQERDNKFMNSQLSEHFRNVWSLFDPDATSYIKKTMYPKFLVELGDPLGWDYSFEHNYLKQQEYLSEIDLPSYNMGDEYQFMDVFEHLILIMIIRREVIHYSIKNKRFEIIGSMNQEKMLKLVEQEKSFNILKHLRERQYSSRGKKPRYTKERADSEKSYSDSEIQRQQEEYMSESNYREGHIKVERLELRPPVALDLGGASSNSDNDKSIGPISIESPDKVRSPRIFASELGDIDEVEDDKDSLKASKK